GWASTAGPRAASTSTTSTSTSSPAGSRTAESSGADPVIRADEHATSDRRELTGGLFDEIRRDALRDRSGRPYREVRRALTPRSHLVWLHLLAGHASLALIGALLIHLHARYPSLWPVVVASGGIGFGYAIAYIQLFFHEAAHYNLASDRRRND